MSDVAAPKRQRRKFQSKLPFFGPTSIGPSRSPSIMQANLPELLALLTTQPKADEDERWCDVAGMATEPHVSQSFSNGELLTNPRKTTTDKCEPQSSSDTTKISESFQYDSPSGVVDNETSFVGKDEAIVNEKVAQKALTESDAVVRKVREVLQEKGLSKEDNHPEELPCSWPPYLILEGTLTAFLDRRPGFNALHKHLYSLVYDHDNDYKGCECGCSFLVQNGSTTGSCLAPSNNSGRQYAMVGDGGLRRPRGSSSSSILYEPAVDDKDDEQEQHRMKDDCTQVSSPSHHQPRDLQAVQKTCDSEAPDLAVGSYPVVQGGPEQSNSSPRESCPRGAWLFCERAEAHRREWDRHSRQRALFAAMASAAPAVSTTST